MDTYRKRMAIQRSLTLISFIVPENRFGLVWFGFPFARRLLSGSDRDPRKDNECIILSIV